MDRQYLPRFKWRYLLSITLLLLGMSAHASHFRYGTLSYEDKGNNLVEFTFKAAFRRNGYTTCINPADSSAITCSGADGYPNVGDVIQETIGGTSLAFGDGNATGLLFLVTDINPVDNFLVTVALDPLHVDMLDTKIDHTYAGPGSFTAFSESCCRIGNLSNNANGEYRVESIVEVGNKDRSAVSSLAPIRACPENGLCDFNLPALDADGDKINYRLATSAEAGGAYSFVQPGGAGIDATTGRYQWNTAGNAAESLWSSQVVAESMDAANNVKSKTPVDFMMIIKKQVGQPPSTNNSPICNTTQNASVGKLLSLTVSASDPDAGDSVTLTSSGLPAGASMTPALPATGNPISSQFAWTPAATDIGAFAIDFTATDKAGQQSSCPVKILVGQGSAGQGSMKGLGFIKANGGLPLTKASFFVSCNASGPGYLILQSGKKLFKMNKLTQAACVKDPAIKGGTPSFNTMTGQGSGWYQGKPATVSFKFIDNGVLGDSGEVVVTQGGIPVMSAKGAAANIIAVPISVIINH
jgi:hypothetical protein